MSETRRTADGEETLDAEAGVETEGDDAGSGVETGRARPGSGPAGAPDAPADADAGPHDEPALEPRGPGSGPATDSGPDGRAAPSGPEPAGPDAPLRTTDPHPAEPTTERTAPDEQHDTGPTTERTEPDKQHAAEPTTGRTEPDKQHDTEPDGDTAERPNATEPDEQHDTEPGADTAERANATDPGGRHDTEPDGDTAERPNATEPDEQHDTEPDGDTADRANATEPYEQHTAEPTTERTEPDEQHTAEPDGRHDTEPGGDTADRANATEPDGQGEGTAVGREQADSGEGAAVGTGVDRWLGRNRVLVPLYVGIAVLLTWPLAANLTDSLPYGTEDNPTVQLFNLWTMRWNQDQVGHLFADYWDAPIFHPTTGAFALSEPQPFTGLVFTPLSWLSGNPVLALNLVMLAIFTANGWAAARLARRLGAAPGAAFLAGVLAAGMPFVAAQMGVLQLTVVFPLFLLVDAIVRWAPAPRRPEGAAEGAAEGAGEGAGRRRHAAEIGLWLAVTFLTCGYYGLFAVVGIGVPALVLARRQWLTRSRLVDAAVAAAVFGVLAGPVLVGQGRITADYERPEDVIRGLSADSSDFWQLEERTNGDGVLPWVNERTAGNGLYPGTALLALGLGGAVVAYRRVQRSPDEPGEHDEHDKPDEPGEHDDHEDSDTPDKHHDRTFDLQRLLVFLVLGAILARALSLGLNLSFGPYRLVRAVVPGYESLRSPFRFAVLTEVFLVGLAAFGLDALWRWRRRGSRRPWGALAAVAVVAAGVVEVGIMPVPLFRVDQETADWAEWIDDHQDRPGVSGDGSFAYLPFPPTGSVDHYADTTRAMLQSLDIGVPTVNGYSGLFPASYDELEAAMRSYPSQEADTLLREHGVSFLVVERDWLSDRVRPWLDGRFQLAFEGRDAVVYEII